MPKSSNDKSSSNKPVSIQKSTIPDILTTVEENKALLIRLEKRLSAFVWLLDDNSYLSQTSGTSDLNGIIELQREIISEFMMQLQALAATESADILDYIVSLSAWSALDEHEAELEKHGSMSTLAYGDTDETLHQEADDDPKQVPILDTDSEYVDDGE